MAIYVDPCVTYPDEASNFTPPDTTWCHMIASDSESELLSFAQSLGIDIATIRVPPDTTQTHFNLTMAQRDAAVIAGAIEVSGRAIYGLGFDSPGLRGSF